MIDYKKFKSETALLTDSITLSYQELDELVSEVARGIKEGEKVPLIAKGRLDSLLLLLACFKAKAVACPISFREPHPEKLIDRLKLEEKVPATVAALFFTSGSSGKPKITALTWEGLKTCAHLTFPMQPGDRYLLALPFFHVAGLAIILRTLAQGATLVLSDKNLPDAIYNYKLSHLSLVPTQLKKLPTALFSSLKQVLLGGAPIPSNAFFYPFPISESWGMTETTAQVTHNGKILPEREVKIAEDQEVLFRGKTLFAGYLQEDGSLYLPLQEGWFATNDLGKWVDGKLQIIGRKDAMFISGGENIYPEEIERCLLSLPEVERAYVVPIDNPKWGKRPVAFLSGEWEIEKIVDKLSALLPKFKVPDLFFTLPDDVGVKPSRVSLTKRAESLAQEKDAWLFSRR